MNSKIDVLISGAGPTGLMAACRLAAAGVSFRLVDKQAAFSNLSRALAVQARTLEIFEQMGIIDKALENGEKMHGIVLLTEKGRATIELKTKQTTITPYPFVLILPQDKTERILGEELTRLGGSVEWKTEVLSIEQDANLVRAQVHGPNGAETIEAKYIIGADGAHSSVRHSLGIEFKGAPYGQTFYLGDIAIDWDIPRGFAVACPGRSGFNAFFPMPGNGRYRALGIIPENVRGQKLDLTLVQKIFSETVPTALTASDPRWMSEYHLHHRFATSFRQGRAFLCGDAAHIHSPAGGQGMNTGLQDAHNLAWKLAAVLKQNASEKLLDSYEQERLPFAKSLVGGTDQAFTTMAGETGFSVFFRTQLLPRIAPLILGLEFVQDRVFKRLSQTTIEYKEGFLAGIHSHLTGKRLPHSRLTSGKSLLGLISGQAFHLIVLGDEDTKGACDLWPGICIHSFPEGTEPELYKALGMRRGMIVVRPDQYVAFSSNQYSTTLLNRFFSNLHA